MKIGAGPRLVVAVPIKDLTHAKQRLTSVLCVGERGELARAMLGDVLRALAAADLGRVWVVTRDPAASATGSAPRRRTGATRPLSRSRRPRQRGVVSVSS